MSTSSEKFVQPAIPKFDGYYDYWSMTMENFLRSREMWSLVEEGIPTMAVGSSPANDAQRRAVEEELLLMAHVSFEEENAEENEIGGDGGASGEDGEALEAGKERGGCHDLSIDAESAKVCVIWQNKKW